MSLLKNILRELLIGLRLDVTANLKIDRLTRAVLRRVVRPASNTVDVGCHQGEILGRCLQLSPTGWHTGFEPIPELALALQEKFGDKARIVACALFDQEGDSEFFVVENEPGYSSLRRRPLDFQPVYRSIQVRLQQMDTFFDGARPVHFIKIDVEGAELQVLKGAAALLERDHPVVLLECGKGGYDHFNESPREIFGFLSSLSYGIYLLEAWLQHQPPLTADAFAVGFESNDHYYFIAAHQPSLK